MHQRNNIGLLGEDLACKIIEEMGYVILERNWRFKKAEIDIIAYDGQVLVFVEVKSRSYTYYGAPEDSISSYKENLIIDAAHQYMEKIGHEWEIRFDIISMVFAKNKEVAYVYYKDAFYPSI